MFPWQQAAAIPGDYDGDGLADLAIIDADEPEAKTTVFVRSSQNGSIKSHVFHPFGDRVISGNFYKGDARTYPGIVSAVKKGKRKPLEWHIKTDSGSEKVFYFGEKGDKVPNQGDLDCDGTTDYTIVSDGPNGSKIWQTRISSNPNATHYATFGSNGDLFYIADTTGDGCSEIITLSPGFHWSSKSFWGGDTHNFQWGLVGDIPMLPTDVDGDGFLDYIISRIEGNNQVAYIHSLSGPEKTVLLGSSSSIPLVGNFFGTNSLGWFERSRGRFVLTYLDGSLFDLSFGNPRRGLLRPDGTDVTEDETGRFTTQVGSTSSNNNSGSTSDIDCDSRLKRDGSGGFKNNPENSKGTVKLIFPGNMTGKIRSVTAYKGDTKFDTLKFAAGNEWGNRQRYYGTKSLRSYPKNMLVVAEMRDGSNVCVTIPDPTKVMD